MRKSIGFVISKFGAILWQNGGWTGDEQYKDLKWFGKLGYNLFCIGFKIAGVTNKDLQSIYDNMTN